MNPFKFGTVVDEPFFINRNEELAKIESFLNSENHLVIISPRRYGKTSLIRKALNKSGLRILYLDMQLILSPEDFAGQLLKRIYRISPVNKLKGLVKSFRIIPSVTVNPVSGETDVTFRPEHDATVPLEDVLNLIDKLGTETRKIVVALDEFQEIFRISPGLDRKLRSIMQHHSNVNYLFSGSSESMIREVFENKKSPFYHFAFLMPLGIIPENEFLQFLESGFTEITDQSRPLSYEILEETSCHPYYTQQLAFIVWEEIKRSGYSSGIIAKAIGEILQNHDNDYERLWNGFNRTDMKILYGMTASDLEPLSMEFSKRFNAGPDSTVYSSLQRLIKKGIIVKYERSYLIDDPFFRKWIILRREI